MLLCSDTGILRFLSGMPPGTEPERLRDAMTASAVLLEMIRNHPGTSCWRSGNRAEAFVFEQDGADTAVQIEPRGRAYARSLREYIRGHPHDQAVMVSPEPVDVPGISWIPPWQASII